MDCGPACLKMVAKYYGKHLSLEFLREKCQIQKVGVSLLDISEAAELIGLKTLATKLDYATLLNTNLLPCIAYWNQNHFVVVYKIDSKYAWIADPRKGLVKLPRQDFESKWTVGEEKSSQAGIILFLEPSNSFTVEDDSVVKKMELNSTYLFRYLTKHKSLFLQLLMGVGLGMLLQVTLPYLMTSVVDIGISNKDISFISLLLIGQIMIFIGSTIIDFLRNWILLHISTRINISLLTDFFIKLMKLPITFFDSKLTGDIIQRMSDHSRIQTFLTTTALNASLSLISFSAFTLLSLTYNIKFSLIFIASTLLYLLWISLFLKARKSIDYQRFELLSNNQNVTLELIQGMQEIKLNNCERQKRWAWERLQAKLFKLNIKSLQINQLQSSGAIFISQGKNILLTFLAAREVIIGSLSLGEMMAIQYIIGQLNSPIEQLIQFIQSTQEARFSLKRINEVHQMKEEEPADRNFHHTLPNKKSIQLQFLSFKYPGYDNTYALKDVVLEIPEGKTTAIVGSSGSGKTTILKLLLRFYEITEGDIKVGDVKINNISPSHWRSQCGVVMQESFIFSDTIAANIAVGIEYPDKDRLKHAITVANLHNYIDSLPLGLQTKIGVRGNGISQGQKQRILIARAVYKDPEYIFFDEATNALDSNNEKIIMENLSSFFRKKTVVVVAHRLSTVKNADQIIVINNGKVSEVGTHETLLSLKKEYYQLIKNQLALDNCTC